MTKVQLPMKTRRQLISYCEKENVLCNELADEFTTKELKTFVIVHRWLRENNKSIDLVIYKKVIGNYEAIDFNFTNGRINRISTCARYELNDRTSLLALEKQILKDVIKLTYSDLKL